MSGKFKLTELIIAFPHDTSPFSPVKKSDLNRKDSRFHVLFPIMVIKTIIRQIKNPQLPLKCSQYQTHFFRQISHCNIVIICIP